MISTPAIKGTILPGITRKSIIDVARSLGFQVLHHYTSIIFAFYYFRIEYIDIAHNLASPR